MISRNKRECVTISTFSASGVEFGERVPGTAETREQFIRWYPMSGKELDALPDGRREKRNIKVFSTSPIDMLEQFDVDSETFEIQVVERWPNHYEAEAVQC